MSANESISLWTREHSGLMLLPAFGAIVAMLAVYWKRHSSPANVILLGFFTLLEAVTLGSVVALFDSGIVLQAFVITTLVFLGLTVFTFQVRFSGPFPPVHSLTDRLVQTKYDFSSMGSYLYATLLVFFFTSLVGVFIPFNRTFDLVVAGAGTLLFSLYIVFDTQMILNRLHVDDWVVACVSLYLECVGTFPPCSSECTDTDLRGPLHSIVNLFLQILRILSDVQER